MRLHPYDPNKRPLGGHSGGARGKPAAYLRVSTSPQETENQRDGVLRAAASRGDAELTWFEDSCSGRSWERPALDELRAAIFRGEVGRVYVWKLDRLSRMGIPDTCQLVREWRRAGCGLVSALEGFDFGDPVAGELLLAMLAWAADWEWKQQQDRLAAARARAAQTGKPWGRPSTSGAQREQILARREAGESVRQIAIALKVPKSTVAEVAKKRG